MDETVSGFELSSQQEQLWSFLKGDARVYRSICTCALDGDLNADALEEALGDLVQSHEILRTGFRLLPGMSKPLQVITKGGFRLRRRNLEPVDPKARRALSEALIQELEGEAVHLGSGSPLDVVLATFSATEHLLVLAVPALCADAVALDNLMCEVAEAYARAQSGGEPEDDPLQYADVTQALQEVLEAEEGAVGRDFWRFLDVRPRAGLLPLEEPVEDEEPVPQLLSVPLDPALAKAAGHLAREHGTSVQAVFFTCWQLLLRRLTGDPDLPVAATFDGRRYEGLDRMLGLFARHLSVPMPAVPGETTFASLARQVEESLHAVASCQDGFTWAALGDPGMEEEPRLRHWPFCFEWMVGGRRLSRAGVTFSPLLRHARWDRCKVKLTVVEPGAGGAGGEVWLEHDARLLARPAAEQIAARFVALLASCLSHPQSRLDELDFVGEAERRQILVLSSGAQVDDPAAATLHALFEDQVDRTPDAPAVVLGASRLTYRELDRQANRLAHRLRAAGVGPESLVAICMERSLELVVAILGVLKAGGAYVPLDREYPPARLEMMLRDSGASLLLTGGGPLSLPPTPGLHVLAVELEEDASAGAARSNVAVDPESPAYVIYTSGSTGRPKGVVIPHRAIRNRLLWMQRAFPLAPSDRVLQKTPYSFDASIWELFSPLLAGAQLVLAPPGAHRDTGRLVDLVAHHGVTRLQLVPSLLGAFLDEPGLRDCGSLRHVFCGGEALLEEHCRRFFAHLDAELCNLYGPTETAIDAAFHLCPREGRRGSVPIGRPLDNVQIYLLGADFRPVARGMTGALYVGGASLARGYLHRADLTAERFLPDPFGSSGGRLYATGDLARHRLDGTLEFLGRQDHQVKIHGVRIELGEIESALGSHPSVGEAVVIAHREESGAQRLVAYVTPARRREPPSPEALAAHLRERLAETMVPARFAVLDLLPRQPNGKVDRRALPSPETLEPSQRQPYRAPESAPQKILAGIWRELLGVERVGLDDNFFELGGDSILSIQVVSRAGRAGLKISAQQVFSHPTIAGIAEVAELTEVAPAATAAARTGLDLEELRRKLGLSGEIVDVYPLSPLQEGLLFHHLRSPGAGTYVGQSSCRLEGEIDEEVLAACCQRIVDHHPILRTSYHWEGLDRPLQAVHAKVAVRLEREEWLSGSAEDREQKLQAFLRADRERAFDLGRPPLMRWTLIDLGGQEHWLVWSHHHIVLDGWSFSMLAGDFLTAFEALRAGREPQLAERGHYRDYISWLASREPSQAEDYWRRTLAGLTEPTPLGVDRDTDAAWQGTEAKNERLSPATTAALQEQARRGQVTLNTLVQAAWGALLGRYSGLRDVVFGVAAAARPAEIPGIESIVGLFLNTLPLRLELPWASPLLPWLRGLHERQAELLRQVHCPLVDVQGWSEIPRGQALFDSILAFENFPQEAAMQQGGDSSLLVTEVRAVQQTSYPLTVVVVPGEELRLRISYDLRRFDAATVSRMVGHLHNLLASMAALPLLAGAQLAELSLLSAAEEHQVLVGWNDTGSRPPALCVHELFAAQAAARRDAVAVAFGEKTLSYGALEERANRLAGRLRRQGVVPGDLVGLCVERSVEMVVGILGIVKAGAGYAPLDPGSPDERLAWMLADLGLRALLTQTSLAHRLAAAEAPILCLDGTWEETIGEPASPPVSGASPDSVVYVMYTSGSTGRPKGVVVPHRAVVRLVCGTGFAAFGPGEVMLQLAPLLFDASTLEIWGALLHGGRLVVMPPQTPSLAELGEALARHEVSTLWLTAGLFHQMVEERLESLSGVRQLLAGGDVLSPSRVRQVLRGLPGTRLINGYGPTENTTFTCCWGLSSPAQVGSSVPIGRPIAATRVYLLDDELRPVPVGVSGELYAGGDGLALGYLGAPELTAEKFVPDPFGEAGSRLYRTGDLARWRAGGDIEFLGRRDSQVKVRGFRIEPGEVEAALAACPGVRSAAVGAREDLPGGKALVAYVVADVAEMAPGDLREALLARLPEPMVPSLFVFLDALPLTQNGKLDRRALAQRRLESETSGAYAPPRTPAEERLAALWAEILGRERVGIHDNFFELGGHSLLAIRLMARIEATHGQKLPLSALFHGPTVAELARCLAPSAEIQEADAVPAWSPLVPLQPRGSRPAFFCVHAIGGGVAGYFQHLVRHLGTDQPFYGFQAPHLGAQDGAPQPSIEDMASTYVREMRRVQPQGPYLLGGASFGGLVAFEMARQLELSGEEVALLALIDPLSPRAPDQVGKVVELDEVRLVCAMVHTVAMEEERTLSLTPQDLVGLTRDEMLQRTLQVVHEAGIAGPEIDLPWMHRYLEGFRSRMQAAHCYRAEEYGGAITLLATAAERADNDPGLRWRGLAAGGVEVHAIPGTHESMLLEPHAQELSGILGRCLAAAAARFSR